MAFIDYYKILGVDRNIPQDQVREAYRKRAKLFHPDLHPNDPKAKAKFQALNEAYDVISDPEKRKKYDQYGERWREADAMHNKAELAVSSIGAATVAVRHSRASTSQVSAKAEEASQASSKTCSAQKQVAHIAAHAARHDRIRAR